MKEKQDFLALSHFLHEVEGAIMFGNELSYAQAYILNDLANQLRDSYSCLEIQKKYNNKDI